MGFHAFLYKGKMGIQLANGGTYVNYVSTLGIKPNVWTHVAVSVDRTSGSPKINFYINGASAGAFVPLMGNIDANALLYIGKHAFSNVYFKGALDELTLYNKALSWIEVRSVFLAGREGKL